MRIQSMNRPILIGLTLLSGILAGCQDFLSQNRTESSDQAVTESAQQTVMQEEAKTSVDCAALEAQMVAAFSDPLAYGIAKDAWHKACWVAPPPQPVDTATLCKDLAATMVSEKAQTLEGYYQPLKLQFDAMNCSQYVGPAPALNLISTQPAPTPVDAKAAPIEPVQPLNQADLCLGLQEAMSSEKAKTDDAYYFQLKTQFGENGCVWVSAPVQPTVPTAADSAKACLNFQQALTQMEPGSPKAVLYLAYIAENCSG
jgi:hypothetical protein